MTTISFGLAHWCVLVAALMPYVCAGIAKYGMFGTPVRAGGYDNRDPRAWLARQSGWRARAHAAQGNCFESLPFFAAAVVIATQLGANTLYVDLLALLFVALRIVYVGLYLADNAGARSLVWALALVVNVGLLFVGYH